MFRGAVSGGAAFSSADATRLADAVVESDYNAQTVLIAVADNTPLPVTIGASQLVGRKATGDAGILTGLEAAVVTGNLRGRAAADQSLTSQDVLQNATGLSFAIGASEEWVASFYLDVGAALATTGIKIALDVPASATLNVAASLNPTIITALNLCFGRTTADATAIDFAAATQVATTSAGIRVDVWVLNSTNAGTVQLQFAQSTSSGTALVLRKGSYFTAYRIA